ncbi:HNH endonuclease [uncultured Clostridium sp.]|uniref:HNH endonuclease n=1 Tax=uncultured Clostridium sp. TaxID=59620 RepID=UPI00262C4CE8|nr:HNH endonuclease signature motif containing protein [uncultured Clostridium sp.]
MLKKFCRCQKIIPQEMKICDECKKKFEYKKKIQDKETYQKYKGKRTDDKEQKFYKTQNWVFTRDVVKARDKGICRLCDSKGKLSFVNNVHHIEELKDTWELRTSMSNLICLCDRCHFYVHKKYKMSNEDKIAMQTKLREIMQ